jgi:hypothetical protein
MNPSPEILIELQAVSPLLAQMEKVNVFTVPEGYFNDLPQRITRYTILNTANTANDDIKKANVQEVPPGYFDTLSDSILARIRATYPESVEEELRTLSPVLYSLRGNVFSVPEGYFESFATGVVQKLKSMVASETADEELRSFFPHLHPLKGNVFSVPDGYFESFADTVFQKLKTPESAEEELRRLSPMLYALKDNVFSVPAGYFESLAENVTGRLQPKPARIVTMKKINSWWKYAAAAIVTGVIAVTSMQIFNSSPGIKGTKSIVTESGFSADVKASFQYKTEDDLKAGIAKLSDDDIIKYLEKNGNVMDNDLLTNNTDASELPSQAEYLTDENTLNTFLEKIDAKTDKSNP